jgi:membrane-anchored protein YejM (alkaline phosphatase superfamily)
MSGLKSSLELSLEKSEKLVPELKNKKKVTDKQKQIISDIRQEYKAKIADKDIMLQDKLKKLHDQIPPNEISIVTEQLQVEFSEQKKSLVDEMEQEIESARN